MDVLYIHLVPLLFSAVSKVWCCVLVYDKVSIPGIVQSFEGSTSKHKVGVRACHVELAKRPSRQRGQRFMGGTADFARFRAPGLEPGPDVKNKQDTRLSRTASSPCTIAKI